MGRAKASHWQQRGIELIGEVSALYSDAQMRSIVGLIGDFDDDRLLLIGRRIQAVAGWLNARLHYEQAPSGPEINAALTPIAKKLKDLRAAIDALDPHSLAAVRAAAESAPADLQTEPIDPAFGIVGDIRLDNAIEQLEQLECWIAEAASQPGGKRGRKGHEQFKEAAFYLVEIWRQAAPRKPRQTLPSEPKLGQLKALLKQSMQPVYTRYKLDPDLTAATKAVLYDGWTPEQAAFGPGWPNMD